MFDQTPYPYRVEWGSRGARDATVRGDIVVIVDALSFSTAVVAAVQAGMQVYPIPPNADAVTLAQEVKAEIAVNRDDVPEKGKFSLSPITFREGTNGTKVILPSLNGAVCSTICQQTQTVLIGSLLNAQAVASYIKKLHEQTDKAVTLIACGEQWQDIQENENQLRPAIEDYLGAGSILSCIDYGLSPEAEVCRSAFRGSLKRLQEIFWESGSGRELREKGYPDDVRLACRLNICDVVPILMEGAFVNALSYSISAS